MDADRRSFLLPRLTLLCLAGVMFTRPLPLSAVTWTLTLGPQHQPLAIPATDHWTDAETQLEFRRTAIAHQGVTLHRLQVHNHGEHDAWLAIAAVVPTPADPALVWDGCDHHSTPTGAIRRTRFVNTFPLAVAHGDQLGVAVGIDPGQIVSWLEHAWDERRGELSTTVRLVVWAGAATDLTFVTFDFTPRYGVHSALQVYFDAFEPVMSSHPGVDPRLRQAYAGGLVRTIIRQPFIPPEYSLQEFARRSWSGWDWYYRPAWRNGFVYDRPEYWGTEDRPYRPDNPIAGTDVPGVVDDNGLEHWRAAHRHRVEQGRRAGVISMYYLMNHADGALAQSLTPDSYGWRKQDVRDGYGIRGNWGANDDRFAWRCFAWGNSWSERLRRDLTEVFSQYPVAGIAWDSCRVEAVYREPATIRQVPRPAWDDDGPFVDESAGQRMMVDWVHQQRTASGHVAGAAANFGPPRQSFLMSLALDTSIAEMNYVRVVGDLEAFQHDQIMRGRRPRSQLSGFWRDPLGNFFNYETMAPREIRHAVRNLHRHFLLMCLYLNIHPEPDSTLGYEYALRMKPVLDAIAQAGWQPAPALRCPAPQAWLARYGKGPQTILTIGNPLSAQPQPIDAWVEVDAVALDMPQVIVGDFFHQPITQSVAPEVTRVDLMLPSADARVLRVLGSLQTSAPAVVLTTSAQRQAHEQVQRVRFSADLGAPVTLALAVPDALRPEGVRWRGQPLPFEVANSAVRVHVTPVAQGVLEVIYRDQELQVSDAQLAGFPFLEDGRPGCTIVVPPQATEAQLRAAEQLREYLRFLPLAEGPWDPDSPRPADATPALSTDPDVTGPQIRIGLDAASGVTLQADRLAINRSEQRDEAQVLGRLLRELDRLHPVVGWIGPHQSHAMVREHRDQHFGPEAWLGRKHSATPQMMERGRLLYHSLTAEEREAADE